MVILTRVAEWEGFLEWWVMGVKPSARSSLSGKAFWVLFKNFLAKKAASAATGIMLITATMYMAV